jgi:Heat induced stress protein YflT domain
MSSMQSARMSNLFELEYPQSVGVYDSYPEAQKVVDFLADSKFPVQNLAIVGTELRSVERVTGRRTWATVFGVGLQNGVTTGLLVSMLMWFLQPNENFMLLLAYGLSMGLVVGVVISVVAHLMTRGRRDFTSVSQTVATKYEILAEHKVAAQAREMVATMPGARAAMFAPPQQQFGYPGPASYPSASYGPPPPPEQFPMPPSAPHDADTAGPDPRTTSGDDDSARSN